MTLAEQLFKSLASTETLEDSVCTSIAQALGCTGDWSTYPWSDVKFDSYDASFELLEVADDFTLDPQCFPALAALGFYCCWLNYCDGRKVHSGFL